MGTLTRQIIEAKRLTPAQAGIAQLLDEQHLCAWSDDSLHRSRFVAEASAGLGKLEDTQVVVLRGGVINDLYSFCAQLEPGLGVDRIRRQVDGRAGVIDALHHQPAGGRGRPIKRRFIIWDDAHVLLRHDHRLFGRLADAIAGVSDELEFATEDALLLQRAVFIGTASLDVYAEDPRGQFVRWHDEPDEATRWPHLTGRASPRVGRWRIPERL